jgi:PEP-CTERM motif
MPSMFERGLLGAVLFGASVLLSVAQAASPSVSYVAQGSGDQWQYDLSFSGSAGAGATLELEFADALYKDLSVVSYGPEFSFVSVLPSIGAGSPGLADAVFAQDVTPADSAHLLVSFTWLGGATKPSSQIWFLSDIDLNPVASGSTVAAGVVPEPGALALAIAGLASIGILYRRRTI